MNIVRRFGGPTLILLLSATALGQSNSNRWADVEKALGRHGSMQPGDVYKFGMPRSDLHVTVEGVAVKPALALWSWLAFKKRLPKRQP